MNNTCVPICSGVAAWVYVYVRGRETQILGKDSIVVLEAANAENFLTHLQSKIGSQIVDSRVNLGTAEIRIAREKVLDILRILKLDSELSMGMFLSVTVVDWMDRAEERFEVVYHLLNVKTSNRLRVKVWVPESSPEIDSAVSIWAGADFMERECWDMYGIKFKGHPDLRRILLYEEFVGHPLRKDYPVQAKQPRIPLRTPEVRNTAVDMKRPSLVAINPRKKVA